MTKLALRVWALIRRGYLALMRLDPLSWGGLRPRGGVATQAISLAIAHFAIHLGAQAQRATESGCSCKPAGCSISTRIGMRVEPVGVVGGTARVAPPAASSSMMRMK
ncbi:MAG: hypothetical protein K8F35_03290 [Dokdonella sp.]|uniref:hypothetical protein n=1 Tax=Dokdonella sp. TaxID=2291710 RepID=UPI0025B89962|nr:hypothetical protein [Dokdonella sp.]MBZ0222031.1 hypothetical protein [Dokdonella sp.]